MRMIKTMNNRKKFTNQPILKTERLILRPLVISDDSRIYFLVNNRNIYNMTAQIPHPYPRELATEWIKTHPCIWREGEGMVYGITLDNNSILTGVISLQKINTGAPVLGYWLGVDFWGNGYATEAGGVLCNFAIEQFGVNRIFACHLENNPASGHVLKKIGFNFINQESNFIPSHQKKENVFNYMLDVKSLVRFAFIDG